MNAQLKTVGYQAEMMSHSLVMVPIVPSVTISLTDFDTRQIDNVFTRRLLLSQRSLSPVMGRPGVT